MSDTAFPADASPAGTPATTGTPVDILPTGEVLVALRYHPAFPGLLDEPESSTTDHEATDPWTAGDDLVGLRCRRSVAEWIGIYLEAFYGGAQIRFEWRGEVLAIYDDPWDYSADQPRLIHPDSDGRYLIRDSWHRLNDAQTAKLRNVTQQRWPTSLETCLRRLQRTCSCT